MGIGGGLGGLLAACGEEESTTTSAAGETTTTAAGETTTTAAAETTTTAAGGRRAGHAAQSGHRGPDDGTPGRVRCSDQVPDQKVRDVTGGKIVTKDGKERALEWIEYDNQSDSNRAAQVTGRPHPERQGQPDHGRGSTRLGARSCRPVRGSGLPGHLHATCPGPRSRSAAATTARPRSSGPTRSRSGPRRTAAPPFPPSRTTRRAPTRRWRCSTPTTPTASSTPT